MLNKAKTLKGYKLNSLDGNIGKVKEFYFDDLHWTVRYLVANTGNWLTGLQVLISPYALTGVNKTEEHIAVDLTKKQIEESPSLNSDRPVSRQFENFYYGYYGYPLYWTGEKQSPEFTEESMLTRDYENRLYQQYKRRGYWVDKPLVNETGKETLKK